MKTEKVKMGIHAADIVALVFMILGGVFTAISIGFALNLPAIQAHAEGDAAMLPLVFGAVGAPFLLAGVLIVLFSLHRRAGIRRIVREGCFVMADVADIRPNFSVQVNGRCPYVLECHYRDPLTGALHVFTSRNLFFFPAEFEGRQIRVYVDRENMNLYYVDTDHLLPDVQVHG